MINKQIKKLNNMNNGNKVLSEIVKSTIANAYSQKEILDRGWYNEINKCDHTPIENSYYCQLTMADICEQDNIDCWKLTTDIDEFVFRYKGLPIITSFEFCGMLGYNIKIYASLGEPILKYDAWEILMEAWQHIQNKKWVDITYSAKVGNKGDK